ncbi:hypothetical protein EDD16DRAFT_1525933 [Pisolithus croceorrhizus]|nr:hypothetical protein EDD16DRAFT_1525933 [Pisolithus croceorrhizus]
MAERYQEILPKDLAVSKEVSEENRFGQGTSKLAWFWMMDGEQSQLNLQGGGLMEELCSLQDQLAQSRGKKGQVERRSVTEHVGEKGSQSTEPGKEAYAKKQMELWNDFAKKARLMFQGKQSGLYLEWEWKHTVWCV